MDTTQSAEIGELVAAIARVTDAAGYVQKTGKNTHHRYTYASDEDLARAIGPALATNGVAILPHHIDTSRDGDRITMVVTWRIAHSSGQWMTIQTTGEGVDKQDKAAFKAMTGARKYMLRLVFCIATGDDAEQHSPQPQRTGPTLDQWRSRLRAITDRGPAYVDTAWGKTPPEVREALGLDFLQEITDAAAKAAAPTDTDTDGADIDAALG